MKADPFDCVWTFVLQQKNTRHFLATIDCYTPSHATARPCLGTQAKFMQDIRAQEERERRLRDNPSQTKMTKREAVVIFQKYTRGWLTRRHVWAQVEKDNLFIGMEMPPPLSKKHNPLTKLRRAVEARHVTQSQYEQTYQAALVNIRKKIAQVRGGTSLNAGFNAAFISTTIEPVCEVT
jgi:hypothetical protein